MNTLFGDYLLLCFLSAMGVIQIAAAHSRLRGILLLGRPLPSALLGLLLVLAGFLWFFLPGPRLLPDTAGGLDGNQQALYFFLCSAAAFATTLLASSLINHRRLGFRPGVYGLDALRQTTYLNAVRGRVMELWRRSPKRTPRSYSGSTAG